MVQIQRMLTRAPQFLLWSVYERIRTYYGLYVDFVPLNCCYWLACQRVLNQGTSQCMQPDDEGPQFHPQIKGAEKSFFYCNVSHFNVMFSSLLNIWRRVWTSGSKDNWNRIKWWEIWDFWNSQLSQIVTVSVLVCAKRLPSGCQDILCGC